MMMIIFLLLYLNFRRLAETSDRHALVAVRPGQEDCGCCGGSVSTSAVAVGFIALAGVAAETGVVMLIYLDHAADEVRARDVPRRVGLTAETTFTLLTW